MKLYDCSTAPSPRRVRVFLAEKGVELPIVQVDLANDEHLSPEFRKRNPRCTVPVLELDDGTCLWESFAICQYLESVYPEPVLLGRTAVQRSQVLQWNYRVEMDGLLAIAEMLRNRARGLQGRALTGPHSIDQIPELFQRGQKRVSLFLHDLDQHLASTAYLVGEEFTVADITALVSVDFAARMKLPVPDDYTHLQEWHRRLSSRPGAVP